MNDLVTTRAAKALAVAAVALCCAAGDAVALDANAGTGAGAFMKIPMGSARGMAMGRAYCAIGSGIDGLAWNPASIGSAQQQELAFSHLSWVQDYSGNYLAYVRPIGQSVVGVSASYMSIDGFDARDANGIAQNSGDVSVHDGYLGLTLARSFFTERLALGATVKRVSENNDGDDYATMVFDLGAQLKLFDRLSLGVSGLNIGNKKEVVQVTRYGLGYAFGQYLVVSGEYEKPSDNRSRLGAGVEVILPEDVLQVGRFMLRAGYYDGDNLGTNYDDSTLDSLKLTDASRFSFGAGLYSNEVFGHGVGLDFALAPFGALGKATQITLRMAF